jgi:DNA-binding YbaB/EbfC family protein
MQARGGVGGGGINELVRQAARMQRRIDEAKAKIKDDEITATAAGDKVTAVVTCEGKVKRLDIDAEFLKSEGLEMSLDALAAAINSAMEKADKVVDEAVTKITGGVKLPGM